MAVLALLLAALQVPPLSPMPQQDCIDLLERAGLSSRPSPKAPYTVWRKGDRPYSVYMQHASSRDGKKLPLIEGVYIELAIDAGRPLTPTLVEPWSSPRSIPFYQDSQGPRRGATELLASIDNTARLKSALFFDGKLTEAEFVTKIAALSRLGEELRSFLGASRARYIDQDWTPTKAVFDIGLKVDAMSVADVAFLIEKLGWRARHGWGSSTPFWVLLGYVRGEDIWFQGTVRGESRRGFSLACSRRGTAEWAAQWVKDNPRVSDWAEVSAQPDGRLIISRVVDITDGKTLGQIRSEVEEFAGKIHGLNLPEEK